ncbi:Gamma-tubulin complex component 6 [Habropoda laboriosa]|uniref:Gamma-tubulin complex component 6 n=1 Tax=Habropoda laboriosa TaxID=597456 RepID=A0A0L7RD44_9HYME|nr:Gamma-tubulin complex component 6 [Habropoda laboriosa]
MNVKEYVRANDHYYDDEDDDDNADVDDDGGDDGSEDNNNDDDDVYGLVTELGKHILQTYRSSRQSIQFTYDHDNRIIKRLRTKAFEILLKKDYTKFREIDPLLEIQKHAFVLKVGLRRLYDATILESLLQKLEESSCAEIPVLSVLQLLVQLKSFSVNSEPITNIFYYGKINPAIPEITHNANRIPPFQIYPIECFISSDKFEATLETQRFQITSATPTNIINEFNFLHHSIKSKAIIGIESIDMAIPCDFMSNHAFDNTSSHTLFCTNQRFTTNSEFNLCILENSTAGSRSEYIYNIPSERGVVTDCLYLPLTQTNTGESESVIGSWKYFDPSIIDESNNAMDIWNCVAAWNQIDNTNTPSTLDYQTWESFGEIEPTKESMFITDTSIAAIHLEKIKQMNNLPLLSEKIMNTVLLLEEVPVKEFINDVKSMLLGVESDSFEYRNVTGFTLRKNISVYGVCSESLENICQEAIHWGNCFRFLSHLVILKPRSSKLSQEGLIFKAMCTNIKELLLYYQAVLLRIFTRENQSERLLRIFQEVRSVAILITKVAKVCQPYKENQYMHREGSSILARIYNEAIKVTDPKVALVFYSLLKSCCEVYFRFLQKWIFEGISDDIYGEFIIKTRPQYLRTRSHKFWTKSFSIYSDAVPGFLSDLAESILQCGKTVRLLRTCDSKNPVCNVCVTEQPEIKVCLSVIALHEQSSRCREYEKKGTSALGSVLSLSTAILNQKRLKKEMSEVVVRTEQEQQGDAFKIIAQTKRNILESPQEQIPICNLQQKQKKETELSNDIKKESRYAERTNIWNYYENLANNINKRCIRSEWRVKRMKLYDKRIVTLNATNQSSKDQLQTTEEANSVMITADSLVETPVSFEDENKNYAETSNNNEKQHLHNFGELSETINGKTFTSEFSPNKELTVKDEIFKDLTVHRTDRSTTIERPSFLNVIKIDNTTTESQIGGVCMRSLGYNMTPNNNELEVQQIEFTPITNEIAAKAVRYTESTVSLNQGNDDLETPMSCTTDNFTTSSVQSPVSQTYHLEDSSSMGTTSTVIVPSYSPTITKSSVVIKEDSTFSDLFELARDDTSSSMPPTGIATPLSITDVEIIDHISLQAYLEKSIRIPLDVQSRLVNNAVIKYFLKENNLLSHLHSLRSYFFLLNGEFAKSLTDSLYARLYEISIPIELFNSATLTNLLERALVHSFSNVYVNSELLSLSATDIPSQLHISDPAALDCLSLNYKISWPLNIILDETVMQQYGKVFKFLITSGRVSWVLQEDFNIMKRERKAMISEQYHKLQLYRHSMTQFMNALHNYLTCSVLHASWAEFEKDLENSSTVDQIYSSHVNYVKRILSRCMLNSRGEKVRVCLNNIFKVILKFHSRIRSQNWVKKSTRYIHPNFKKLEQMYRAFCELRAYMAHVAFKLATSGYQPHLTHFLNALNINQTYDVTVKTCRGSTDPPEL